jgi:hypothetical protein
MFRCSLKFKEGSGVIWSNELAQLSQNIKPYCYDRGFQNILLKGKLVTQVIISSGQNDLM